MEALIYFIGSAALTAANVLISNVLGWVFTEWKRPVFNVKPFSCRPCLTFWFTAGFGMVIAVAQSRDGVTFWLLALIAFLSGLINFYYIQSKIKINE